MKELTKKEKLEFCEFASIKENLMIDNGYTLCWAVVDKYNSMYLFSLETVFPELYKEITKRQFKKWDRFAWNPKSYKVRINFLNKFKQQFKTN